MASRTLVLLYSVMSYVVFLGSFVYAVGFVGNWLVPKSIDSGQAGSPAVSLGVNLALLTLFALQHSVMARPAFKRWWTTVIPEPIERSTYVLLTSGVLVLLFWRWRPMTAEVWNVEGTMASVLMETIFWLGWLLVLTSTFLIDHFDLFGLKQGYCHFKGRSRPTTPFKTPLLYRYVRHPIMLGFIIAFWATPKMTAGHLLFSAATTSYILIAIRLEEQDLVAVHGEEYRTYQRQTSMLIFWPRKGEH